MGDKFAGAKRKHSLNERMATSVKEVQKLHAQVQKAVGKVGEPFAKKSKRDS
jgi:hypothetical protein